MASGLQPDAAAERDLDRPVPTRRQAIAPITGAVGSHQHEVVLAVGEPDGDTDRLVREQRPRRGVELAADHRRLPVRETHGRVGVGVGGRMPVDVLAARHDRVQEVQPGGDGIVEAGRLPVLVVVADVLVIGVVGHHDPQRMLAHGDGVAGRDDRARGPAVQRGRQRDPRALLLVLDVRAVDARDAGGHLGEDHRRVVRIGDEHATRRRGVDLLSGAGDRAEVPGGVGRKAVERARAGAGEGERDRPVVEGRRRLLGQLPAGKDGLPGVVAGERLDRRAAHRRLHVDLNGLAGVVPLGRIGRVGVADLRSGVVHPHLLVGPRAVDSRVGRRIAGNRVALGARDGDRADRTGGRRRMPRAVEAGDALNARESLRFGGDCGDRGATRRSK